jgi:hypothetical protein
MTIHATGPSRLDRDKGLIDQMRKADQFRALHVPGNPLVLFNIWDAGSARAVAASGAKAIATGSWSVANANGFADGERIPLAFVIDNVRRIVGTTDLPLTVDLESGYGDTSEAVADTIGLAVDAGAIGCNLEDGFPATGKLRETVDQVHRIRRARHTADATKIGVFINARTDIFFQRPLEQHDMTMVSEAIERALAYADAGRGWALRARPGGHQADRPTRRSIAASAQHHVRRRHPARPRTRSTWRRTGEPWPAPLSPRDEGAGTSGTRGQLTVR